MTIDPIERRRRALQAVTNRRQARRVMAVDDPSTLVLELHGDREWYVTNTDDGLYVAGYSGGALYMCRHVDPEVIQAQSLVEDDVIRDPPGPIRRARRQGGEWA